MEKQYDLDRFLEAQQQTYENALREIRQGSKQTHWMWFIFPQLRGLGFTDYNIFYGIEPKRSLTVSKSPHTGKTSGGNYSGNA